MSAAALQRHGERIRATDHPALDRLTALDVSKLRIEQHGLPLNVAAPCRSSISHSRLSRII
ncbi:MAG: hypothetical protein ACYC0H_14580 [Solirubrobacteraceae bacterium]